MSTLACSRPVSLSDHHQRRRRHRSSVNLCAQHQLLKKSGGENDSDHHALPQCHRSRGGCDGHAAPNANWNYDEENDPRYDDDAPSCHDRGYSYSTSDQGYFIAENCTGGNHAQHHDRRRRPVGGCANHGKHRGHHTPYHHSPPQGAVPQRHTDVGGQRRSPCPFAATTGGRRNQEETAYLLRPQDASQECSWDAECSHWDSSRSAATTSTANSSNASSQLSQASSRWSRLEREEAIHALIFDLTHLIASYVARALSFLISLCLMLTSPFVQIVRMVVGDAVGLWRDAAPRRKRQHDTVSMPPLPPEQWSSLPCRDVPRYHRHEGNAEDATETSPIFVGGWRPGGSDSVSSQHRSVGSATGGGAPSSQGRLDNRSCSSSNLPWKYEGRGRNSEDRREPTAAAIPRVRESPYSYDCGPPPPHINGGESYSDRRCGPPFPASHGCYDGRGYGEAPIYQAAPMPQQYRRRSIPTSTSVRRHLWKKGDVASV